MTEPRVNWRAVAVYYVLACAISWPFYGWRDLHPDSFAALDVPWFVRISLYMCGPALAAVIVMFVLRMKPHERRITLLAALIGGAAERTRAVVVAIAIHLAIDRGLEIGSAGATAEAAIGFACCLAVWVPLLWTWPPPDRVNPTTV